MATLRPEIKKLRDAFLDSEMSVDDWAEEAGVSTSTIYQMLRGKKVPTTKTYDLLASVLNLKLALVGGNGRGRK